MTRKFNVSLLTSHAKLQNPMINPSGRKVRTGEEERGGGEKNVINSGH